MLSHSRWHDRFAGCWWQSRTSVTTKTMANHVKLIQSKARGHEQVKVIFDNSTKASSLKEALRCRGNSKGIRSNVMDSWMLSY